MRAAGIHRIGGTVESLDLPDPRALRPDEVLIEVAAGGVGNWDDIARTGGWDLGATPPMALGVEAAGTVIAVGAAVTTVAPGADVLTHALPLREQGAWAERFIAPADQLAPKPATVAWDLAAGFPVPALTAEQTLHDALDIHDGQTVLVNGASGLTGGLMVQIAALRGLRVIATAGPGSIERVRALGATDVLDYHDSDWPAKVRELTGGAGVPVAANAARGGAGVALSTVADGGRLATITSDLPATERGISLSEVYVQPNGPQLATLAGWLGEGRLTMTAAASFPLADAAAALARARKGAGGGAVALTI